jgi:hypothetical protein
MKNRVLYKKGIFLLIAVFTLLLSVSSNIAKAQEVSFTASAKTTVAQGETFRVNFVLNAEGDKFKAPEFKGFDVVSGPNPSTSSSYSISNGKVSQTIQQSYIYLIHASATGTFTIGPASITVGGKEIRTNSLQITVVKGNAPPQQNNVQQGTQGRQQTGRVQNEPIESTADLSKDDVFIKAYSNKSNIMEGEQVIVTYKIYTKVPVANIRVNNLATISGFWSQDLLDENKAQQQQNEIINGEQYVTAEIKKLALVPLKTGAVTLPAMEMELTAQVQKKQKRRGTGDPFFDSFFNDAFFNSSVAQVEKKIFSNALKINVQPLPAQNKPADFSGAVGDFTFTPEIDRTELKANEAINLKITIAGNGNIDLIDKLKIEFPTDFETYDPKVSSNINKSSSGISGKKVFEYLIIPRNPGEFRIKPFSFSWYDLKSRTYLTKSSPEYVIRVAKGDGSASSVSYSAVNQQDVQYIGSDIRHIKLPPYSLRPIGAVFFASDMYFLILLLVFFAGSGLIIYLRIRQKQHGNKGMMRLKYATKVSRKRLQKASVFLKEGKENEFYNEVSAALWGYIADKFGIALAELSMDSVNDALLGKQVNDETVKSFSETLNNCEFARFAPGDKVKNMDQIYNQALEVITRIERELK